MEDNKIANFYIFDTIGINRLRSITQRLFEIADGIVLIYDITKKISFDGLQDWLSLLKEEIDTETPIVLFGNKNDMVNRREITKEEAEKFAKENKFLFFESSIKNVSQNELFSMFIKIAKFIYENSQVKKKEEEKKRKEIEEKKKSEMDKQSIKKNLGILMKYISF